MGITTFGYLATGKTVSLAAKGYFHYFCRRKFSKDGLQRKWSIITSMNFTGLIIGVAAFLMIGMFHPIVIKAEYHFGTHCWWAFLIVGLAATAASLITEHYIWSTLLGVFAFSCFWSILEIFEQQKRVEKGWFPANPKRKDEYNFRNADKTNIPDSETQEGKK